MSREIETSIQFEKPSSSKRLFYKNTNVWFYPKIRLVPQSEYSFWGITETDCLVFDTYFGSNVSWTRNGPAGDSSSTQWPPREIHYIDETGKETEAIAAGYSRGTDSSGEPVYQAAWIKPQVVKCITTRGYIPAITIYAAPYDGGDSYMGLNAIIPAVQPTFSFDATKLSYPWYLSNETLGPDESVGWDHSYHYGNTTPMEYITYCLYKQVSDIYKYRKFYFIVPTGCSMQCCLKGLDFWAYNGFGVVSTLTNWSAIGYGDLQGYYYGSLSGPGLSSYAILEDGHTLIAWGIDDNQSSCETADEVTPPSGFGLYDTSTKTWARAMCNIKGLDSGVFFSDTFYTPNKGDARFTVRDINDDVPIVWKNSYHPSCSGMTIDYGAPQNCYMKVPSSYNAVELGRYYGYLNKDCVSLYNCTLAYKPNRTSGMAGILDPAGTEDGETKDGKESNFWNVVNWTQQDTGGGKLAYTWEVNNQHDSNASFETRIHWRSAAAAGTNDYDQCTTDLSDTALAFSSTTCSGEITMPASPSYWLELVCVSISNNAVEVPLEATYSFNNRDLICIDGSYNSNYYSYIKVTEYVNNKYTTTNLTNTASSPGNYKYPRWFRSEVVSVSSYTRAWNHSVKVLTRVRCRWRQGTDSWTYKYGDWKYLPSSFSSLTSTGNYYDSDLIVSNKHSVNNTKFQYFFDIYTQAIKAPTITSNTDAGNWKRSIKIYNPNPLSVTIGYTNNKTTSKTSANSGWSTFTLSAFGSATKEIADQSGYSDEWIIVGVQITTSSYYCNTYNEDIGDLTVVNSNFTYTR